MYVSFNPSFPFSIRILFLVLEVGCKKFRFKTLDFFFCVVGGVYYILMLYNLVPVIPFGVGRTVVSGGQGVFRPKMCESIEGSCIIRVVKEKEGR